MGSAEQGQVTAATAIAIGAVIVAIIAVTIAAVALGRTGGDHQALLPQATTAPATTEDPLAPPTTHPPASPTTHPPASVAVPPDVTSATLASAEVPSLCDYPAGKLVDGEIPGIDGGLVGLSIYGGTAPAFGEIDGQPGGDAAVVSYCSAGAGQSEQIEVYAAGTRHVASLHLGDFELHARSHVGVHRLTVTDGTIEVRWTSPQDDEPTCCGTLDAVGRFRLAGDHFEKVSVETSDEAPSLQAALDAANKGDRETLSKIASDDAAQTLLDAASGGATIFTTDPCEGGATGGDYDLYCHASTPYQEVDIYMDHVDFGQWQIHKAVAYGGD